MSRTTKTQAHPTPAVACSPQNIRGVALLSLETQGGVLYAQASGLVTMAGEFEICRRVEQAMGESLAACLDYSRTLLAITEDGLVRLFRTPSQGKQVLFMAWVLPDEPTAELWRGQAQRFALVGLRRFATTDLAEARAWAALQSRAAAACRARRRVEP